MYSDQEIFDFDAFLKADFDNDTNIDQFEFDFPFSPLEIPMSPSPQPYSPPQPVPPVPSPPPPPDDDPPPPDDNNPPPHQAQNNMTHDEFCNYLNFKIDPKGVILITKEMYMNIEIPFIKEYGNRWIKLRRDDKRKKERVLNRLYENANLIYEKLEEAPDKYLYYVKESIINKYFKND